MKRIDSSLVLFMVLLLVFTLALTPAPALANEGDEGSDGDFSWIELADGTVAVKGYTGSAGGDVTIPGTLSGMPVTAIADAAFNNETSLTAISIPEGVTTIGEAAFNRCENLAQVALPTTLTSIDNHAFAYSGLSEITIPDNVTSIGEYAFLGCDSLTSVTLSSNLTSISNYTFQGCTNLPSIIIPDSVTMIGERAFYGCTDLTGVTFSNNLTSIGDRAFANCLSLAVITIPDSVTSIGIEAFASCINLTGITIPDGVTSIGILAFTYCTALSSVTLPTSLTFLGAGTFSGCSGLTDINIPEGVTTIGEGTFSGCSGLTSITISDGVTVIGNNAFVRCTSLTDITIPPSVTTIENAAFEDCSSLAKVTILSMTASFGTNVFSGTAIGLGGLYGLEGSTTETYSATYSILFHLLRTVSFDTAGGSYVANAYPEDGSTLSAPANPTRSGYAFDGWYREPACINPWDFAADTVTGDITLYAKWTVNPRLNANTVTVTYDSRGGSAVPSQTAERYTVIEPPENPTRAGYAFGGWYMDAACTQVWDMVTGRRDMTVYAKWSPGLALYLGGRGTLNPDTPGGAWAWDSVYISLIENSDGTVTVKGLKAGTVAVTYTIDGTVTEYQVTVLTSTLPPTGQNGRPVYILLSLALGVFVLAIGAKRKRDRRSNVF